MNHRTRLFLSSILLPIVLLGISVWLTWRAVKQERLDRALIAAVKKRKAAVVVSLLKQGADPNAREIERETVSARQVLHSLFLRLSRRKQPAQQEGDTALTLAFNTTHVPIEPRIVQALLDAGADSNCRDTDRPHWTPLYFAVTDCPSQVRYLLEKGAVVNVRDDDSDTPLMYSRDPAVARLLLDKGADVNAHNKYGRSVLAMFLDSGDSSPETLRLLLDRGVNVNERDESGWIPLMWAVKQGKTACVRLLLDRGAKVNAQSADGGTALMEAAWIGEADAVRALLKAHANVNLKDNDGRTAYRIARQYRHREIARFLKQAGAKE